MDAGALRTFDEQSLSGKIIHVDRQGKGLAGHPFCPEDDNLSHVCTKLYAKGFRNPFRFQLRPGGAGPVRRRRRLGVLTRSSTFSSPGGSYGWPCYEGATHTPDYSELAAVQGALRREPAVAEPAGPHVCAQQRRWGGRRRAAVHRHALSGGSTGTRWFFGDYVHGWLRTFNIVGGQVDERARLRADGLRRRRPRDSRRRAILPTSSSRRAAANTAAWSGSCTATSHRPRWRTPRRRRERRRSTSSFSADESLDPDGDAVTYAWDFGDGSADATGRTASHTYTDSGVYTARLTVRDARGLAERGHRAGAGRPHARRSPRSRRPADGSLFRHGVPGAAARLGHRPRGRGSRRWRAVAGTSCSTTARTRTARRDLHGAEPSFTPPGDHDADSYYEIELTATDSDGVVDRKTVEIHPETVPFTLASVPAGVPLSYSGVRARRAGEAHRRHRLPHVGVGARPVHARRHRLHLQGLVRRWGAPAPDRRARRRVDADGDVHGARGGGRSPRPAGNSAACRRPRRPHGRRRGCASTARAGGRGP